MILKVDVLGSVDKKIAPHVVAAFVRPSFLNSVHFYCGRIRHVSPLVVREVVTSGSLIFITSGPLAHYGETFISTNEVPPIRTIKINEIVSQNSCDEWAP